METIRKPNKLIKMIIREQEPVKKEYRPFTFCVEERTEAGVLLLNDLTHELLLLSEREYADRLTDPTMIRKWFCVPVDFNDKKLAGQVRNMVRLMDPPTGIIEKYTIFTTTACNARCFYCFENGWKTTDMSEKTAVQAAEFILRKSGDEVIHIDWFGGEPLYNAKVIDIISRRIQESGRRYYSLMISNGYLFDDDMIRKARDLWNLQSVGITIDGTEPVYNRIKSYIYKEGNPFERVLNNIDRLQKAGIGLSIRLNMDRHNVEDLYQLVDVLGERFGGREHMYIVPKLLYENLPVRTIQRTGEQRKFLYDHFYRLAEKIESYDLDPKYTLKEDFRYHMCMADSDTAVTIMPDGRVGLCEHYVDSDMIGDIWHDAFDQQVCQSFKKEWPEIPECSTCGIYPECTRLEKCRVQVCYKELSDYRIWRTRKAMVNAYRAWKETEQ